jgi:hypothetical protein
VFGNDKNITVLRCFVWVENNYVVTQLPDQKLKTSSLSMIFNNKRFQMLDMSLSHIGNEYKLPTRNSEEPKSST